MSGRGRATRWLSSVLAAFDLACAPPASPPWIHPTEAEWHVAAERLSVLRCALPRFPYTAVVTTVLRDPGSGQRMDGRGAIAVAPGEGIRMILVGGAGGTLLDAWVTPSQWRIAVPWLSIVRRGGPEAPREYPIAFLRWWFFARFEGSLFASSTAPPDWLWLVRDGDAVVELRLSERGPRLWIAATRRDRGRTEHVDEWRTKAAPSPGDSVRYVDESNGLAVDLAVEEINSAPPDPAAFRDPDADPRTPGGP
jgi:hypothetical protein